MFTHASPKVEYNRISGGPASCELADILVVVDDPYHPAPLEQRRSVLIQAKMLTMKGNEYQLQLNSSNEQIQYELMSTWPGFWFKHKYFGPRKVRDIKCGPQHWGWSGEYGGIEPRPDHWWAQYHILGYIPSRIPAVGRSTNLGRFLAGMLAGRMAHGRAAAIGGADDWSDTVQELLNITYARAASLSGARFSRGQRHTLLMQMTQAEKAMLASRFAAPSRGFGGGADDDLPPTEFDEEIWPDGPISVVHFTIGEGTSPEGGSDHVIDLYPDR